ncbi:hypothetical protein [Ktedonobacter sp. SOSP1-52]|uniref:hypothetical protein n=1 Tax=Ktedonobacter sp. SOSP1-52 TaxID=2778366 RepID=UPI001F2A88EE|nr:hypothetical protein [Ktedonobacter sp. SOSP1-52]
MPAMPDEKEPRLAPRSLIVRRRPLTGPGKSLAVQTARASQFAKPRARRPVTTEEAPEFSRSSAPQPKIPQRGSWLLPLWARNVLCAAPRPRRVSGDVVEWSAHR